MRRAKKKKYVDNYKDFTGICWHNYFWVIFLRWDMIQDIGYLANSVM